MSFFTEIQVVDPTTGKAVNVNADGQMHIVAEGHLCTENSTSTPLSGGATWTGTSENILAYNGIAIFVTADVASAVGGLEVQYSDDEITWYTAEAYSILAGTEKWFTPPTFGVYFRLNYTNGAGAQSTFKVITVLRKMPFKWSSHNIDDSITDEDDAELVKAVLTGKNPGGTFVNFQATTAGNFKVSLEELENGVSSNSNSQLNVTPFHADGSEGALISGVNYVSGKSGIDASTESLQLITYEHHEIHSGSHFYIQDVNDLPISNVFDMQFTTPNTTKWIHFTFQLDCESETDWYIYEGATINVAGTSITPINNNRNSATASGATVAGILNTSLANANSDTDVSGATEIAHGMIGSLRNGGSISRQNEIILKQNTIYCFRAIANAAGFVDFNVQWYEHTAKN